MSSTNTMSSIPYGRPLGNQTLYVLNFKMQPCPVGVPGELYIGGIGLAQGYHADPERTESAFITHPTCGKLYKTGDMGVLHPTGIIEFLGRKDQQVKIKGYRIEIGEIEARLRDIQGIQHAVVMDREDEKRKKYLCAYVVTRDIDTASIKNELRKVVPAYMIPTYILDVEHIPLTANGKVDRKSLPDPSTFHSDSGIKVPINERQQVILEIWRQILDVSQISIEDNFFELGGDSLLAQKLVNMVEQQFNIHLPIRKIFMEPTIEAISHMLQEIESVGTRESVTTTTLHADQSARYYWSPSFSWRPENDGIIIGSQYYTGIAGQVIPTLYFLTQEGFDLKEISNHFVDIDHDAVHSLLEQLIQARVLIHGIMTPAEVFSTQNRLLKHYENEQLADTVAYDRHKLEQLNRSSTLVETREIHLFEEEDDKHLALNRKTYRVFDETADIPFDMFSELLSVFRQSRKNGEIRYQYASAGGLYSIDVYIEVKDRRIEQMNPGIYYYDPIGNSLKLVSQEGLSDEHHYFNNKAIYRSSAFSLFFVYNAEASAPVYGTSGYYYACIDTGIMVGLFTQRAESLGIGLCSIGEMNFAEAQHHFRLNPSQIHMHTLEGGLKSDQNVTHYPSVSGVPNEGIISSREPERVEASSPQQRLYILQRMYPEQTAYNNPIALEMNGILDVDKLQMVLNQLVLRHEILRTSFELRGESVMQVIHPRLEIQLHCMQAHGREVEELVESVVKPFELSNAPLLRIHLFEVSPEQHILILDAHHIILDRMSGTIFAKELMELYQEKCLSPLKAQYKDFSERQRKMADTETYHGLQEQWLNVLAGELPVLQLPTDFKRPLTQNFAGSTYHFGLNPEQLAKFKSMSTRSNVTLYMALLAAFKVLLYKYTGQNDLIVGSPVAGRLHQDYEHTMGMFANTAAIRSSLIPHESFEKLMQQVKDNVLHVFEIQAFPFEELVDQLHLTKDMSRNPLFDVMFTLQNMESAHLSLDEDLQISLCPLQGKTAKFDLTLEAQEIDNGLSVVIEYGTALFEKDSIKRMADHFIRIVDQVSSSPEIELRHVEMLSGMERDQVLCEFNDTQKEYQDQVKLIQLVEEQSARMPNSMAVSDGSIQLTYDELNQRANQLAHTLRSMGVTSNDIVGIMAHRSVDTIVGLLGILKAGATYLPIDPEYPTNRMNYLLNNSGASIVLAGDPLPQLEASTCTILTLTDPDIYDSSRNNLAAIGHPEDPIYVIYTSGTTGTPKGVEISNRSFINLVNWYKQEFDMSPDDRILLTSSLSFDLTQKNVFAALLSGAQLHLFNTPSYDYSSMIRRIEGEQITLMNCTPSAFYPLTEWTAGSGYSPLRSLRHVFLGGEPIDMGRLEGWLLSRNGNAQIVNTYGPTECTDVSVYHRIEATDLSSGTIPIGRPLPNVQLYILDAEQNLLPPGIEGELYISGDCVGLGYLNDMELTNQKFVQIPRLTNKRLYKTGDRAKWRPDGTVEYLGRIDAQVKVRGYRIEPGEIERQLLKHSSIRDAVVIARPDADGNSFLCAYFVTGQELEVADIREHLKSHVPDYLIPSSFIRLERIPLTPNGKVDKQALPEPEVQVLTTSNYEEPATATEKQLARLWEDVLHAEQVGADSHFFEMGGHSLRATFLAAKIHEEFEAEIPVRDIFTYPTLRELAARIDEAGGNPYRPITVLEQREYYALSSAQKRMYVLHQLEDGGLSYNMPAALTIEGDADVHRIEAAMRSLIHRHESLRTSFELVAGEPMQRVSPAVPFRLGSLSLDDSNLEAHMEHFVRPFDLTQAPLFRSEMIRLASGSQVLLLDMHHIISDGMSQGLLIRDFVRLYNGESLPELTIQYKEFAAWQNEELTDAAMEQQKDYWLQAFEGEIPVLNLQTDFPRPSTRQFEGGMVTFEFEAEGLASLKELAASEGSTLYMVLLAAYSALLYKYTGQSDMVIGSPVAGRRHRNLEDTMGMFVNTLAMRSRPEGEKTFRQLLQEVREQALRAYENQDYPFEELVDQLSIRRDMSRNPLFDIMLVLQNTEQAEMKADGVSFYRKEMTARTAKFDLLLHAAEEGPRLRLDLEYSAAIFKRETIERLSGHLLQALRAIGQDPEQRLADLEIMEAQEKRIILEEFNGPPMAYPRGLTLVQLFERQVEVTPDRIAAVQGNHKLTYRELNAKANQLANKLRRTQTEPNQVVAILMERSAEFIISVLAILKTGGTYLPIDIHSPVERIHYMLEDSKAVVLLTHRKISDGMKLSFAGEILLFTDAYSSDDEEIEHKHIGSPNDLAYIMYTSGSTGRPKGVLIEHRSVIRLVINPNYIHFQPGDRILLTGNPAFDAATFEIWGTLLNGLSLHIVDDADLLDPYRLADQIRELDITVMWLTASLFNQFSTYNEKVFAPLRVLLIGGEALSPEHVNKIRMKYPALIMVNGYGPTENTTFSLCHNIETQYDTSIPIGRPVNGTRVYIMDSGMNLSPIGVPGELCVAGDGLAKGYLNMEEATALSFVSDPFLPNSRLYKTGDRAKWWPDGTVEYLGRIDTQVKVRGYRIEPGEIERQLLKHTSIRDAVVIARPDGEGNSFLCAYLVTGQEIEVADIREHLKSQVPDYMIPSSFMRLDRIPLTPNGKVDKQALPEPEVQVLTDSNYEEPATPTEKRLARLWKDVLHLEQVGADSHFFEMGGHSLRATFLAAKIHEEFEAEIPVRDIFAYPTLKELASRIDEAGGSPYRPIAVLEQREHYALSSAQKRMYVLHQLEDGGLSYNMPAALTIEGDADVHRIEAAMRSLIHRHESLRTSFELVAGEPMQRISPDVPFRLGRLSLDDSNLEAHMEQFVRPFDLSRAPLFRADMIQLASGSQVLLLDMHHIISDGMSQGLLIRDFVRLYNGESLPELTIQYKEFAAWQNEELTDAAMEQQKEYWLQAFGGEIPVLNLQTDFPRPSTRQFEGGMVTFEFEAEGLASLKELAASEGSTLYMVLLAAYSALLYKYTGQSDMVIGSPVAGRRHRNLEDTMGMFVNTLAMRSRPEGEKTFRQLLQEVREQALRAYENQDYPFEELVDQLSIRRDMSRNPLFDVMLVLQNTEQAEMKADGVSFYRKEMTARTAKFDLLLHAAEEGPRLRLDLEYSAAIIKRETIERLSCHLLHVLRAIGKDPEQRLADLEIMEEQEKRIILEEFNGPAMAYPQEMTIGQLFERQVEETPDRIAAVHGNNMLTYRELNTKANQLARLLQRKGTGMGTIVPILLDRSLGSLVATLGIIKAGGTILPIDPGYPAERIHFILKDCRARILVTLASYLEEKGLQLDFVEPNEAIQESAENLGIHSQADDALYVIYTSGTTGEPKGTILEHNNLINLVYHTRLQTSIDVRGHVLQFANISFDVCYQEIFSTLLSGGALHIIDEDDKKDIPTLIRFIARNQIRTLYLPTAFFKLFGSLPAEFKQLVSLVDHIIVAGEKLLLSDEVRNLLSESQVVLHNHYGPSETHVITTYPMTGPHYPSVPPIGKPIANNQIFILDRDGSLSPIGCMGEVYVSGDSVGRGYLNRPEQHIQKFIHNPMAPAKRMYRTGDYAKWLPDGNIEYLGRIDHQMKIRGYRVELKEIESRLFMMEAVSECFVCVKEDGDQTHIVAYVVWKEDVQIEEIKKKLMDYLPEYMIPSLIVPMDSLPLTSNGKVDSKALPDPRDYMDSTHVYEAPRDATEEQLYSIWAELLGDQQIGIHDNFFLIGGQSLKATVLAARIQMAFHTQFTVKDVFLLPTIAGMADKIRTELAELDDILAIINEVEEIN